MAKRTSLLAAASSFVGTEVVPISQLSTTVFKTGTTLSASSTDNSYNDSANGFLTAGFLAGMAVNVIGFTGNTANNIHSGVIQSVTAGKMIIASPEGDLLVTDAAGESVTIRAWTTKRVPLTSVMRVVVPITDGDMVSALAAGTGKFVVRAPCAMTLTDVRASLGTAQTSGSIFTVDVNVGGSSILSTKLTIDNTERTSTTAATARVLSSTAVADDAEIIVDIDQIGDGTAKGLTVTLVGYSTS